jgi:hypothetical protein
MSIKQVLLALVFLVIAGCAMWWISDRDENTVDDLPVRNDAVLNIDLETTMPNDNDGGSSGSNPNNP